MAFLPNRYGFGFVVMIAGEGAPLIEEQDSKEIVVASRPVLPMFGSVNSRLQGLVQALIFLAFLGDREDCCVVVIAVIVKGKFQMHLDKEIDIKLLGLPLDKLIFHAIEQTLSLCYSVLRLQNFQQTMDTLVRIRVDIQCFPISDVYNPAD